MPKRIGYGKVVGQPSVRKNRMAAKPARPARPFSERQSLPTVRKRIKSRRARMARKGVLNRRTFN